MKEIRAYIKPHRVSNVTTALRKVGTLTGLSLSDGRGFGRTRGEGARHRIVDDLVDYMLHTRLEVFCDDGLVDEVVSIIIEQAHTGLRGGSKIYVIDVETAVRISTGECGEDAV